MNKKRFSPEVEKISENARNSIITSLKTVLNVKNLLSFIELVTSNLHNFDIKCRVNFILNEVYLPYANIYEKVYNVFDKYPKRISLKMFSQYVDNYGNLLSKHDMFTTTFSQLLLTNPEIKIKHIFQLFIHLKLIDIPETDYSYKERLFENLIEYETINKIETFLLSSSSFRDFIYKLNNTIPDVEFSFILIFLIRNSSISHLINEVLFEPMQEIVFPLLSGEVREMIVKTF